MFVLRAAGLEGGRGPQDTPPFIPRKEPGMVRVPAEDIKQVATVIDGTEYRAERGFFEMPDAHAKAHLESGNLGSSWNAARGATGRRSLGYRCPACGHGSFFRRCGKCGTECEREA